MEYLQSVRSRVVLVTLACILPASLAAAVLIGFYYQRERDRVISDSLQTARALVLAVDRDLASTQATLLALSTSRALAAGDLADFYTKAKAVLQYQDANNIVLIDARRRQLVNTLMALGAPLPVEVNPQLYSIFQTGRPVITDLFLGPVAHRPLVAAGVPVMQAGKTAYILAAGILPERLSRILTEQRLPQGWVVGIFDSSGTIVARSVDESRFVGKKGSEPLIRRMEVQTEGSLESVTLEGIPVYSAFSHSSVSNWSVVIGVPTAKVTAQLWQSVGWLILVTAALLTAGFAFAWRVGGEIVQSFYQLIKPAAALGQGGEVSIPSLRLKEARRLGEALAQAATERQRAQRERDDLLDQLRALNSELEERVADRTGELAATLNEREILLKEVHHRVKNNLQVVSSLINMQLRHVPDREAARTLEECKARVQTMALIHEQLYRSRDFASISFSEYFGNVAKNVFQATGVSSRSVELDLSVEEASLGMEKAIPCGLILNELLSNALKHAFPAGRHGRVHVALESPDLESLRLIVADDGVGLPPGLEIDKCASLGLQLVSLLAEQLGARLGIHSAPGAGTRFELLFPLDTPPPPGRSFAREAQSS